MIDETLFKKHFVGRDGFQWWIGQIPPEESWRENIPATQQNNNQGASGFGERYRVRIMGYHTANADDIPDDELPWAYVMYPVTAGGGGRGSSQSANLTQGTFVFGWFIDGDDAQLPIIMGVLGYNDYNAVMKEVTPTRFIPFSGYPAQDEVHGSKRSALQVRESGGDEVIAQQNATGNPTNDQITESAQGNTTTKIVADAKPDKPVSLAVPNECAPLPINNISTEIKNALNEVQKINQMIYDARASLASGVADAQKYIEELTNKLTEKISGFMKSILNRVQKELLKVQAMVQKIAHAIFPPDVKDFFKETLTRIMDTLACVGIDGASLLPKKIKKVLNDVFGVIENGVQVDLSITIPTKLVNAPACFIEDFVSTIIGDTLGPILNTVDGLLADASNVVSSIEGLVDEAGDIVMDVIALLQCLKNPKCASVKEWSMTSGSSNGGSFDLDRIISKASSVANNVATSVSQIGSSPGEIDFSDMFNNTACDVGPNNCGPPIVQVVGPGTGAKINLIVSSGGEVMGGDIISSGYGFDSNRSTLNVFDICGLGQGAVVEPIFGPVIPNYNLLGGSDIPDELIIRLNFGTVPAPEGFDSNFFANFSGDLVAGSNVIKNIEPKSVRESLIPGFSVKLTGNAGSVTLPSTATITSIGSIVLDRPLEGTGEALGASLSASGASTQTGIIGLNVINSGYGYLPEPNGSSGGDGQVWANTDDTVIIGDGRFVASNGGITPGVDGFGTDYYPPVSPGNTVNIPPGSTVTTPANSYLTEGYDSDGNTTEILPGTPTLFPNGGSMTSPSIMEGVGGMGGRIGTLPTSLYPSSSSYPVILYLCELIVDESGMDYQPTDKVVIKPDMGATAVPTFDRFGRLLSIKVTAGGEGFQEMPQCYIESDSGFGSFIIPKFCIDRVGENDLEREPGLQDKIISVIDCVGSI